MNKSAVMKARWADPAMRAKYLAMMERTKKKRLANLKAAMNDPAVKAKRSIALKAAHAKRRAIRDERATMERGRETQRAFCGARDPLESSIFGGA